MAAVDHENVLQVSFLNVTRDYGGISAFIYNINNNKQFLIYDFLKNLQLKIMKGSCGMILNTTRLFLCVKTMCFC